MPGLFADSPDELVISHDARVSDGRLGDARRPAGGEYRAGDARRTGAWRALELEIHTAFEQITAFAVRALARARLQHDAAQDAVQAELNRLERCGTTSSRCASQ